MKLIQITTEIKNMLGKVYYADVSINGIVWVNHEGNEVRINKDEYVTLDEEEAMIAMFKDLTGKEPEYESKLDEARDENLRLSSENDDLREHNNQLQEEILSITGGF